MITVSAHNILNNHFTWIKLIKIKDIKNCDHAASHSSSLTNYSDPESQGGFALFPGEEQVIPAFLHRKAVQQVASS